MSTDKHVAEDGRHARIECRRGGLAWRGRRARGVEDSPTQSAHHMRGGGIYPVWAAVGSTSSGRSEPYPRPSQPEPWIRRRGTRTESRRRHRALRGRPPAPPSPSPAPSPPCGARIDLPGIGFVTADGDGDGDDGPRKGECSDMDVIGGRLP
ncbi:hypothetical protein FB451DRAFT_1280068, partial [Mycena latifolia]